MTVTFFLPPLAPPAALAAEPSNDYILRMAKADYFLRQQEFAKAVEELGRMPKEQQGDALFLKYTDRALKALYGPAGRPRDPGALGSKPPRVVRQRLRVTSRKKDAGSRSDQSSDPRGHHVSEHLEADIEGERGWRRKFVLGLEGFKNGHNDVRYTTLLADFYRGDSHLAFGDSTSFPSHYFLRGSRPRGLQVILPGDRHELQIVGGAYPIWLEDRDEYIYPRKVFGLRDKWTLFDERVRVAGNFVQTRDTGKIRTEDGANPQARTGVANQIRDNLVLSFDQEFRMIPEVWYLKASEAWSDTDDDLNDNRFGDSTKLKDSSFRAESLMIQPWAQIISRYERTGPDFMLLTDLPQGAVNNPKTVTVDRQIIEHAVNFKPLGPFDLDLQANWYRNNLGNREDVEMTRQSWYTAELGVRVPHGWPRPRMRASMIDTVSSPGPVNYPNQTRTYLIHPEVSHFLGGWHVTGFADYQAEIPMEDKRSFSAEERWALGARLATTLNERFTISPHYTYRVSDEDVDLVRDQELERLRVDTTRHEAGVSTSYRLWDTASLGLSYDFLSGKLPEYASPRLVRTEGHSGTASFTWPYTRRFRGNRRKFTFFPGILFHLTDLNQDMGRRPLATGRLSMGYEAFQDWKLELMGEYRYDTNEDIDNVHTEESRMWLLWTSDWEGKTPLGTGWTTEEEGARRRFEADLSLRTGYRVDDLNWNIAGDTNGKNPNILSELTWEELQSYQVGGTARVTARPFLSGRLSGNYAWIFKGDNQDSDYDGDNRTLETSRSNNASDDGSLLDLSGGVGYPWEPRFRGHAFRLTPLAGYSYHEQNLTLTDGVQTIPATGPIAGLDSEYQTRWKGPWVGLDLEFKPFSRIRCFGTFEYHWAGYKADARWNLRTDFAQPKSFRHTADGNGLVGSAGIGYLLSKHLSLELSADYQRWSAEDGVDRTFFSGGTSSDTRFNEVDWESLAVSLGVRGRY